MSLVPVGVNLWRGGRYAPINIKPEEGGGVGQPTGI